MASQPRSVIDGPPPPEEGYIHTFILVCAYCKGKQNNRWFKKLNDEQYTLMREGNFDRENFYCRPCIGRLDAKLNRHKVKEARERARARSAHGTTNGTCGAFDSRVIASSQESRGNENVPPNRSQLAPTQGSSQGRSQGSSNGQRNTQPGPSHQLMPPPRIMRRIAVKSTGGLPKPYNRPSTSRGQGAGASNLQPDPSSQSSTESSEMQPNYAPNIPSSAPTQHSEMATCVDSYN